MAPKRVPAPKKVAVKATPKKATVKAPKVAAKKAPPPLPLKASKAPLSAAKIASKLSHKLWSMFSNHDTQKVTPKLMALILDPSCGVEFAMTVPRGLKGFTPFLMAAVYNNFEVLQLLATKHRVNTKLLDSGGNSALHHVVAQTMCNLEAVKFLVEVCGCDVTLKNKDGKMPIDLLYYCSCDTCAASLRARETGDYLKKRASMKDA